MEKKAQSNTLLVIVLVLVVVLIIVGILMISGGITGKTVSDYKKNCETRNVPYETTEYYDDYLEADIVSSINKERVEVFGKGVYQEGTVKLRNIDDEAGWFTVIFKWETLNKEWEDEVRHYVEPDEEVEFISIFDISMGEDNKFSYNYLSDPIRKSRTVKKYRLENVCD